ncbi:MAG: amidohydrolase family protein [Acidimicrobiia bacterium]|nr:amidohydrolase family protein [Acidimicrobiia bacterium]MYE72953.1 amidohydrolase family protein [Acidimicrobiia bacterium]MYJ63402.1 amidohydrolase family protein [Acidimicrobiia bacterium]
MSADIVIRGGIVVDGSGEPGREADVAITGDRISEIGSGLSGKVELDAGGQVVAPGFIDIHTHYDAQVFWDPALTPSCYHGVTSVIAGNCGFSIAPTRPRHQDLIARTLENVEDMNVDSLAEGIPWDFETFPEYLDSISNRGIALNFGAYIGHTALRLFVVGDEAYERASTDEEVARMVEVVAEAIDAGAAGLATSFAMTHRGADGLPIPSRFATRDEFESLIGVLGQKRRGVVSIAPGEQIGIDDMYALQPQVGVPFTYGALLTFPNGNHEKSAAKNREAWEKGIQVWPQVTPRPLTFQMVMSDPFTLNVNPEFAALMSEDHDARLKSYDDEGWRNRTDEAFKHQKAMKPRWETFQIAETGSRPELIGRRLTDVAEELGVRPLDVLLDTAVADDLTTRISCIIANDDPDGVAMLLQQDGCTLGLSDAGAHVGQLCDAPQATDFLGNWVRDRELMPMEKAVRKLSGVQADLFNLVDRGYLREGAYADVVVFDPDTVAPGPLRRIRDFPANAERLTADASVGINHVLVNGTPIRIDGEMDQSGVDAHPGDILRPSAR